MNNVVTIPIGTSGLQLRLYATVWSTSALSTVWSASTGVMEPYNVSNLANYAVAVAEIGQTGIYQFVMPSALQNVGESYDIVICQRPTSGASPVVNDSKVASATHTFTAGRVEQLQINTA